MSVAEAKEVVRRMGCIPSEFADEDLAELVFLIEKSRAASPIFGTPLTITGTFRLHFNRHGAAPFVWSVRTDEWEINVAELDWHTPTRSVYRPKETPDDEDGKPSAWLETSGTLQIVGSRAVIR